MSDFRMDFKDPTTWLLAPLLAPLLPLALLSGCSGSKKDVDTYQPIAAGKSHTCTLLKSGSVKCWGHNNRGQLGDGTEKRKTTPVDVSGLSSDVQAIAAGDSHTCALLTSGGVKCWGYNDLGQLGNGTKADQNTPVDVSCLSSGVKTISAGAFHTCAALTSGGVKCWGHNNRGQLGDGTTADKTTPIDVSGLTSNVQAIAAGNYHTCALLTSGGVKCWGWNSSGRLGNGTKADQNTPVDVSGLSSGVKAIATGEDHTCALLSSGGVKCWGDNDYGQLGNGTRGKEEYKRTPVDVSGLTSSVQAIAAGMEYTCALLQSGGVKCWGNNWQGQLGNGTKEDKTTPVDVSGLTSDVQAIATGWNHTCAQLTSGGVKCWGRNEEGQLGDGAKESRTTPVDVSGF